MYIKDLLTGKIRKYGTDRHDSLLISEDGRTLEYQNLQNGDGSRYGDYRFTDEKGIIHEIDNYFNIGGFITENKVGAWIDDLDFPFMHRCSNCNATCNKELFTSNLKYCYSCGAKMQKLGCWNDEDNKQNKE